MATIISTSFGLEQRHIDRLDSIMEELLRRRLIRQRNRSDVMRLLIEDFSLPNWSTSSTLPEDQIKTIEQTADASA